MFALEPIKPLTTKLQKRNQQAYKLVDETIDFIRSRRADIDDTFDHRYSQACSLLASVRVEEAALPRRVERQVHKSNHPGDSAEEYFRRMLFIPFLDNITYQLETWFDKKRICAELLVLTPTISASDKFDPASEVANMLTWEYHLPCPVQLPNGINN